MNIGRSIQRAKICQRYILSSVLYVSGQKEYNIKLYKIIILVYTHRHILIHLLIKYTIPLYMYLHVLDAVPMEEKLRQDLFSDYDNLSRPVDAWEDSVKVHLDYSPLYFMGLVCYSKLFKMTYLRYSQ